MAVPDASSSAPLPAPPKTSLLSIERVVALATPVFAAAAGWVFTAVAKIIPGINLPHDQFVTVFVSGAVLATTAALTWLFGRQKFVHFIQGTDHIVDRVGKVVQDSTAGALSARQIQAALEAHEAAVVDSVSKAVGLPPSAEDVAKEIVGQLWKSPPLPVTPPPPPVDPMPATTTGPVQ